MKTDDLVARVIIFSEENIPFHVRLENNLPVAICRGEIDILHLNPSERTVACAKDVSNLLNEHFGIWPVE